MDLQQHGLCERNLARLAVAVSAVGSACRSARTRRCEVRGAHAVGGQVQHARAGGCRASGGGCSGGEGGEGGVGGEGGGEGGEVARAARAAARVAIVAVARHGGDGGALSHDEERGSSPPSSAFLPSVASAAVIFMT
eukprot:scaffold102403_cov71-Phaeocystis_antarctica.AAC.5